MNRPRRKTAERVAHEVVRDIAAEGLRPGDHLPLEAAMLERYGVSRGSLREALRVLEVEGLVSIRPGPGGGPVVGRADVAHLARTASLYFHLSGATYAELFEAQAELEPIAAEQAARHAGATRRAEVMAPFTTTEPGEVLDPRDVADAVMAFHRAIHSLAGNDVFGFLALSVTSIVAGFVAEAGDPPALRSAIGDERREIAEAITGGSPVAARDLMAQHLAEQLAYYRRTGPARLGQVVSWR